MIVFEAIYYWVLESMLHWTFFSLKVGLFLVWSIEVGHHFRVTAIGVPMTIYVKSVMGDFVDPFTDVISVAH